jgi:hypothetical protein
MIIIIRIIKLGFGDPENGTGVYRLWTVTGAVDKLDLHPKPCQRVIPSGDLCPQSCEIKPWHPMSVSNDRFAISGTITHNYSRILHHPDEIRRFVLYQPRIYYLSQSISKSMSQNLDFGIIALPHSMRHRTMSE